MFSKSLVILALCVLPAFSAPSPLIQVDKAKERVAGRYIVILKDGANRKAHLDAFSRDNKGTITHEWDIINGFAATLSAAQLEDLRSNPDVVSIEEDGLVHTQATVTQTDAPWGLGRINSQKKLANQNILALNFKYSYDSTAGSGAVVYVIDTGVSTNHPAFGGRASWGITFGGYPDEDGSGHGTHVAGTAISGPYGVAKGARVIAVKVLDESGSGSSSDTAACIFT